MDNVEATNVLLTVYNDTSTTHVTTTSDHDDVAGIELDKVNDLARLNVELDGVVDLDQGVGVTDGAAVVGDNVWDTLGANTSLADLEELVGSLLRSDAVDGEAALDVVQETEVLARLLDGDDIYTTDTCKPHFRIEICALRTLKASGVGWVGADLAVDLDEALHDNREDFLAGQSVLQPVTEENGEREGFPELVRTGRGAGSLQTR